MDIRHRLILLPPGASVAAVPAAEHVSTEQDPLALAGALAHARAQRDTARAAQKAAEAARDFAVAARRTIEKSRDMALEDAEFTRMQMVSDAAYSACLMEMALTDARDECSALRSELAILERELQERTRIGRPIVQ